MKAFLSGGSQDAPPTTYDREPVYEHIVQERDVMVSMRDGVHICIDIYRPDAPGRFPVLLAFANHNKELQSLEVADALTKVEVAILGIACIVDRTLTPGDLPFPVISAVRLKIDAFDPQDCPLCRKGVPAVKPGSRQDLSA